MSRLQRLIRRYRVWSIRRNCDAIEREYGTRGDLVGFAARAIVARERALADELEQSLSAT